MNRPKRVLVDCSFIHEHPELNTGIQRVVRKIIANLEEIVKEKDIEIVLININNSITRVSLDTPIVKEKFNIKNYIKNIYKASRDLFIAIFPHPKLKEFLYAPKEKFGFRYIIQKFLIEPIGSITKNKQYQNEVIEQKDIVIEKGDILLLLDSTWHLSIWEQVKSIKDRGVRVVSIVYDIIPISHPKFCDDHLVLVFKKWFENSINYVDEYIAISNTVKSNLKEYLIENYPQKVKNLKFDYFYLGGDFIKKQTYNNIKINKRLKQVFNSTSTYLIVSTIEPRKNHKYLLDTFDKLWAENLNINLCIVGRVGWKIEDLMHRIENHILYNKNLFVFSTLNDLELQYCYNSAKMLLFPSIVEGYGLPIIESLSNSLPVFASDTPIHREVGGDKIDYFDINRVDDLVEKIKDIEKNGISKEFREFKDIKIISWKESAEMLLEKIIKSR